MASMPTCVWKVDDHEGPRVITIHLFLFSSRSGRMLESLDHLFYLCWQLRRLSPGCVRRTVWTHDVVSPQLAQNLLLDGFQSMQPCSLKRASEATVFFVVLFLVGR